MSKHTYPRVVELLDQYIPAKISRNEFCRLTGVNRNSVDRYRAGLGCPTDETLEKMADYFGVTVSFLRGAPRSISDRLLEGMKACGVGREDFNSRMAQIFNICGDYWRDVVKDHLRFENADIVQAICQSFKVNKHWLLTGGEPSSLQQGGFVGEIEDVVDIGIFGNYLVEKGRSRELAAQALKKLVDVEMYNKQIWIQDDKLEIFGQAEGVLKLMYEIMGFIHDLFPDTPKYTDEVAGIMKKIAIRTRNNYAKFLKGERPEDNFDEAIFGPQ